MTRRTPVDPSYLRDLFSRNASTYDRVNAWISFGQVERWRRELVALAGIRPGDAVLDAFAGPGSLSRLAAVRLQGQGRLVLADLSPPMLDQARQRLAPPRVGRERSLANRDGSPAVDGAGLLLEFVTADVLAGDTDLGSFDVVLLGFGLRYVADVPAALTRLGRYLRPGGRLAVLEFTRPRRASFALPARWYFDRVLPHIAAALSGDAELYAYLQASSRAFLTGDELVTAFPAAGLQPVAVDSRLGGLVTLVVGAADASEAAQAG